MYKFKCVILAVLILILSNEVGLQRINPWWGLFAIVVFAREIVNDLWYIFCAKPRRMERMRNAKFEIRSEGRFSCENL